MTYKTDGNQIDAKPSNNLKAFYRKRNSSEILKNGKSMQDLILPLQPRSFMGEKKNLPSPQGGNIFHTLFRSGQEEL